MTFVCLQCGETHDESQRTKDDARHICVFCDDENGFRELLLLINNEQTSTPMKK